MAIHKLIMQSARRCRRQHTITTKPDSTFRSAHQWLGLIDRTRNFAENWGNCIIFLACHMNEIAVHALQRSHGIGQSISSLMQSLHFKLRNQRVCTVATTSMNDGAPSYVTGTQAVVKEDLMHMSGSGLIVKNMIFSPRCTHACICV